MTDARAPDFIEFFWRCWDAARGVRELDGGQVQEWGEELGLLKMVRADAPCGEGCQCEEYTGSDFPTDCYRPTVERGSRLPAPPDDAAVEGIRSDEAVRDAFVECYTLQSIITDERRSNVDQWAMEQWDRVESLLIRAILTKGRALLDGGGPTP